MKKVSFSVLNSYVEVRANKLMASERAALSEQWSGVNNSVTMLTEFVCWHDSVEV